MKVLTLLLLLFSASLAATDSPEPVVKEVAGLEFSLQIKANPAENSVTAECTLKNKSGSDFHYEYSCQCFGFYLKAYDAAGNEIPYSEYGESFFGRGGPKHSAQTLKKGDTLKFSGDLSKLFRLPSEAIREVRLSWKQGNDGKDNPVMLFKDFWVIATAPN